MVTDDHPLACSALAHLVRSFSGLKVVAELADGRQLLDALSEQDADVVIVDAAMPVLDGFETVAAQRGRPGARSAAPPPAAAMIVSG